MVGVREQADEAQVRDFLSTHFEIISIDTAVAETAVTLRRTHRLRLPDAIIWATSQVHKAILVTRNTKDFQPDDVNIRLPYSI